MLVAIYLMCVPNYVHVVARNQEPIWVCFLQKQVHLVTQNGFFEKSPVQEVGKRNLKIMSKHFLLCKKIQLSWLQVIQVYRSVVRRPLVLGAPQRRL